MAGPDQIIDTSRALCSYLVAKGALPDDTFTKAIAAAEALDPLERKSNEYVELQLALNEAIKLAHPKTLADIYPRSSSTRYMALAVGLCFLLACGLATTWQTRMTNVLGEFDKAKQTVQENNIVSLIPIFDAFDGEGIGDYGSLSSQARIDLRNRLYDIRNKQQEILRDRWRFEDLYAQAKRVHAIPSTLAGVPESAFSTLAGGWWNVQEAFASPSEEASPPATGSAPTSAAVSPDLPPYARSPNLGCFEYPGINAPFAGSADSGLLFYGVLQSEDRISALLKCLLRVDAASAAADLRRVAESAYPSKIFDTQVQEMRDLVEALSIWILPALYGGLGAVISLLRAFLSENEPNPPFAALLARLSLGAFAGVAIGWFTAGGAPKDVALGVLTLSFLVGYSISVFLAILDSFVRRLETWAHG